MTTRTSSGEAGLGIQWLHIRIYYEVGQAYGCADKARYAHATQFHIASVMSTELETVLDSSVNHLAAAR